MSERKGGDSTLSQVPVVPIDPRLAALLDGLPDAAVAVSPHGLIVYANAGVTNLLGYQPEEVRGQPVEMLVPEALRQTDTDTRSGSVARRMGTGLDLRARRRDGAEVLVEVAFSPLPHNSPGAVLALIRDVSDYVQARDEAQSEATQLLLLTELARAIAELGAAGETYGKFAELLAAIVPHDRLVVGVLMEGGQFVRYLHVSGTPVDGWESDKTHEVRHLYMADILASKKPRFGKAINPGLQAKYPSRNALVAAGLRSTLLVPLIVHDTPIGFLFLASREEDAYAEKEAAIAEDACRFLAVAIDNQRLVELSGYRAAHAEALADIGRVISSAAHVEAVFHECAEKVQALVPMDRMTVSILDRVHGTVTDVYSSGVSVESWERGVPHPQKGTNTALIVEGAEPLIFNAASAEELGRLYPQFAGTAGSGLASAISVPLRHGGRVIGALHLRSRLPNAYKSSDIATVQAVADQIAGAVHYELLIIQMKQDAERRHALAEIGRIVSSTLEIEDVYPRFADQAAKLVPFDRIVIALFDEDQRVSTNTYVMGQPMRGHAAGRTFPVAGSTLEQLVQSKKSFVMDGDETQREAAANVSSSEALRAGLLSVLITPLIWQDRVIGSLNFRSKMHNPYTPAVVALAEQMSAQVAGAITASTLYRQTNKTSEERRVLAEIGRIVSSTSEIEDVYPRFAEQVANLVPFDRVVIALFDEDQRVSLDAYMAGTDLPGYTQGGRFPVAGTLFEQLISSKNSVLVDGDEMRRLALTHAASRSALSVGLLSVLITPLIWQDRVIGSLNFRSKMHNPYTPAVVALAKQVSAQVAGAITASRLYLQTNKTSEERRVLAEIGRIVSSTSEIEDVYPRFAEQAAKLIPFDRIVIALFDEARHLTTNVYVGGKQLAGYEQGRTFHISGSPLETVLLGKRSIVMDGDEVLRRAATDGTSLQALSAGLMSLLSTPIVWQDRVVGMLSFRSEMHSPYTPAVGLLAEQVAAQVAGAITTSRLYHQAKQDALIRTALAELGRAVNSDLNLGRVCQAVADALGPLMSFDRLAIALSLVDGGKFQNVYVTGVPVDGAGLGMEQVPFDAKQFGLEREDRCIFVGDQTPALIEVHRGLRASGLRAWMQVPVGPAGQPLAYISVRSRQQDAYTEQDLELLKAVALQVAPAFRNATLLEDLENRVIERTADLSAAVSARTRMLATVSHELRNLLAAAAGFNQVLLKDRSGNLTKQQLRVLRNVESSNSQINSLVNDLTDFANVDAGQMAVKKVRLDLAGLVKEVTASFAPAAGNKQQKIFVSGCDRLVIVQADRDRIAQVLRNLISNASKYSPEGSEITVSLEASDGAARTAVRDHGIGISEEDRKQLFQSFFRANNPEVRSVSGTGLGLAVSKTLMELHDGGIDVASTPGRGSVFTMWLPLDVMAGGAGAAAGG